MPESRPIKLHMFPPGWDVMDDHWFAVPFDVLQISGKVAACVECGAVVPFDLMSTHEQFHSRRTGA